MQFTRESLPPASSTISRFVYETSNISLQGTLRLAAARP